MPVVLKGKRKKEEIKLKVKVKFDNRMLFGIALFFLYVGIELSVGLWSNSYLVEEIGLLPSTSGYYIASYYASIMIGRFLSGTVSNRLGNRNMIRLGLFLSGCGALLLLIFRDQTIIRIGLMLVGLGFAPLYPSMMHETPQRFNEVQAHLLISYQVGIAYIGGTIISTGLGYLFKPFGILDFNIGNKRLGEVYILDKRTKEPILKCFK